MRLWQPDTSSRTSEPDFHTLDTGEHSRWENHLHGSSLLFSNPSSCFFIRIYGT